MLRRLFNALEIVSLLLFLVTVVLWVRSYTAERFDRFDLRWLGFNVHSILGRLSFVHLELAERQGPPLYFETPEQALQRAYDDSFSWRDPPGVPRFGGFQYGGHDFVTGAGHINFRTLVVPHWAPAAVTAPLGLWWAAGAVRRFHRRRRAHARTGAGRCPRCGYDLTGNTSGTCPECGTPRPPAPPA